MIFCSLLINLVLLCNISIITILLDNIPSVVKLLQKVAITIFQWFKDNEMKVNADKCHQEY